jgi:drug/metabolite transporter superfamily protein YnfA
MMRQMNRLIALLVLLVAATLETGGDALVRAGIRTPAPWTRFGFLLAGAVVLFFYGWTVNTPPWGFGRLLGVYVVLVFLMAQVLAIAVFGQWPDRGLWLGGALIVGGGVVIAMSAR